MIRNWGVRARVVLVAVAPAIVLGAFMIAYFTHLRLADLEQAYSDRGRALARQVATATEYAVFANNIEDLQRLLDTSLREEGVLGVLAVDASGRALARAGRVEPPPASAPVSAASQQGLAQTVRFFEPIEPVRLNIGESGFDNGTSLAQHPLGGIIIDISNTRLNEQRDQLLNAGASALLLVLIGSVLLAIRMSQGVSEPIRDVARIVARIGAGHLHDRVRVSGGGSLQRLGQGVNEMAERLQSAHREMMQRIDEATAELRNRTDEAERADMAKSRFLAAASHDLRQPMHALGLFIAELAEHPHPPETHRLVRQIQASAEAMENLLDSLLDISRLDAGALEPKIVASPLQPILDRIDNDFQIWAEERGLRLRVRPCAAWIRTDPLLFERILSNLVSNAIRYTPRGTILIACRPDGDQLRVEVRDSGKGIDTDKQEVIFQEFVQLDNPERARTKGLGLGLAIVRRLTLLLGHTLMLRSRPGHGSVFGVRVERCAPQTEPDIAPAERPPGTLDGTRVLVVDDDPLALASLDSLLAAWGCEVTAASSLGEALALLDPTRPPEVLITDYRLQGHQTGLEVIERIAALVGYRLRSILITGDTGSDVINRARAASLPILHKPVRPAKLRAVMQRLLSQRDEETETEKRG
ncbi:response regulator [Nitrogeniibacter mangrovi]|uniref:histidine kinase n=1 Tax=Nitrogeniibacter mangrovi TaxID=2016596 RepID=A0A6C1B5W4_9RHOO|nr:ATP-binding protein [Nitrogeniibacter mangrovi]QID19081.1 response regulator [Nitrogeniibacter mangrovi]